MKRKNIFMLFAVVYLAGCISFSQKDYDLQEKAYQKERQQQEAKQEDAVGWRW